MHVLLEDTSRQLEAVKTNQAVIDCPCGSGSACQAALVAVLHSKASASGYFLVCDTLHGHMPSCCVLKPGCRCEILLVRQKAVTRRGFKVVKPRVSRPRPLRALRPPRRPPPPPRLPPRVKSLGSTVFELPEHWLANLMSYCCSGVHHDDDNLDHIGV